MFRLMTLMSSLIVIFTSFSSYAEPQHWRAKKGDTEYMIIGSVHVGDKSMYPLPKNITKFLEQSSGLIIEADVRSSEGVVYPVSSILSKDVLDKTQRQLLVNIAKDLGMAEAQLLNAPPWTAALTIQLALVNKLGYVSDEGVDMHLIGLAEKKHLPVLSLDRCNFKSILLLVSQMVGKKCCCPR